MTIGTYKIENYSFINEDTKAIQTGQYINYYTLDGTLDLIEEFIGEIRQGYEPIVEEN
jgi:hypothetical protein